MPDFPIEAVIDILNETYPYHPMGDVTEHDPFRVLICCLLSLRSRDVVTMPACARLFMVAKTPQELVALPPETVVELIEPVQFFRNKVQIIQRVSQALLDRFNGEVPADLALLESLKGVGPKTANLVMQLGFNLPAIAVDTHVHRICNRLGYVHSKTPETTAAFLRLHLPTRYWSVINRVMVRHGQEVCIAGRPRCDICPVYAYCQRVGVTPRKSRRAPNAVHEVFLPKA